jgi:hypothetical protein
VDDDDPVAGVFVKVKTNIQKQAATSQERRRKKRLDNYYVILSSS